MANYLDTGAGGHENLEAPYTGAPNPGRDNQIAPVRGVYDWAEAQFVDPRVTAARQLARGSMPGVARAPTTDLLRRALAASSGAASSNYDTSYANQNRGAQMALIDQMRAQQAGPSIANMQGQRAMGQMGQQALMQGGRSGMLGAQMGSAGLAGDVGQARLAEVMRSQAGMGGVAGQLRQGDQASALGEAGDQLRGQQGLEGIRQVYARLMADRDVGNERFNLDRDKISARVGREAEKNTIEATDKTMQMVATLVKMIAGGA